MPLDNDINILVEKSLKVLGQSVVPLVERLEVEKTIKQVEESFHMARVGCKPVHLE